MQQQLRLHQLAQAQLDEIERLVPLGVERLLDHLALVLRLAQLEHDVRVGRAALVGRQQPDAARQPNS